MTSRMPHLKHRECGRDGSNNPGRCGWDKAQRDMVNGNCSERYWDPPIQMVLIDIA